MIKRFSAFFALFLTIEAACAQTRPLILGNTPPSGVTVIPPVSHSIVRGALQPQYMTVTQHVIPRYVSGATQPTEQPGVAVGPAGQLVGWGPMSVLRGNAQTQRQKVKAVVKTEDFGELTAQWSSGQFKQPNYRPAILRPAVRDCTIAGHDETGSNYFANGVVSGNPGKNNPAASFPDLYGGVFIQATAAHIENVTAFYIPGTAFLISRSGSTNAGPFGPWDSEASIIRNCQAHRAYRGFDIQVVDTMVGQLQGYALRDYGVKFSAGAAQIDGAIHFWSVSPGPCVWFGAKAGACWGGPFYVENSPTGMLVESSGNQLGPIYSKSCPDANIKLAGQRNLLGPIELDVADGASGVVVYGQFNRLLGGSISLHGTTAVGVRVMEGVNNGNGLVIRDVRFLGSSATEGVAITTANPLNNATIKAHIQNVGTGIELYPNGVNKLGMTNDIDITTWSVTTPIQLPPTWHPSNRIRINGVLQEPGQLQR
jgi:hypothetical protein